MGSGQLGAHLLAVQVRENEAAYAAAQAKRAKRVAGRPKDQAHAFAPELVRWYEQLTEYVNHPGEGTAPPSGQPWEHAAREACVPDGKLAFVMGDDLHC